MKPLSIYIHIPFCVRKCFYCDFLSAPVDEVGKREYLEALLKEIEWEARYYAGYEVQTVFIGGGTPSILNEKETEKILCKLKEGFTLSTKRDLEITMEVNPGTASFEALDGYRKAGVNRLSIGLQSADHKELELLGRIHRWEDFERTFEDARRAGFHNINVDIMSALPGQSIASYRETLRKVVDLKPEHISAYSLIIEEETPFFDRFSPGKGQTSLLPSEEEDRLMYELTETVLRDKNYSRYEISNYAMPGFECRHNKVYWQRGDYVGFGLGAASMVSNVRWDNVKERNKYIKYAEGAKSILRTQQKSRQKLTMDEQMEEFMFLGLRLTEGVSKEVFFDCFQRNTEDVYGEVLRKLEREGLIVADDSIRLTSYGMDISNYVMAQFLLS